MKTLYFGIVFLAFCTLFSISASAQNRFRAVGTNGGASRVIMANTEGDFHIIKTGAGTLNSKNVVLADYNGDGMVDSSDYFRKVGTTASGGQTNGFSSAGGPNSILNGSRTGKRPHH